MMMDYLSLSISRYIMNKFDELYKMDSTGKVRVYFIEIEDEKYRMCTGVKDGKIVRSKWTTAKPKNIGRSNETTAEGQALLEVTARYNKKLNEGYFDSLKAAMDNPDGKFFSPMLATEWDKVIAKYKEFPLLADPKLDGMRMTMAESDSISRKGKPILTADHIREELEGFFINNPKVRLDGELYNHDYNEDFNTLMRIARRMKPTEEDLALARKKLEYHVYDVYFYDDPLMPAHERKQWLEENLPLLHAVKLVKYKIVRTTEEVEEVKQRNVADGYEGTITRGYFSMYINKQSRDLLKIKDFITEEYLIHDIQPGRGNKSDIAGTVVVNVEDVLVGCGIRGSWGYCKELLDSAEDLIGSVATIRHFGKTPDGSLRFPVLIDVDRPD